MKIYYNPKLKQRARELRKSGTLSEALLWNKLKAKKMCGLQFMRQKPIDEYIVDFYCAPLKLIIEIDGDSHNHKAKYDNYRQKKLKSLGLNFLRFRDIIVKTEMEGVLNTISNFIEDNTTP